MAAIAMAMNAASATVTANIKSKAKVIVISGPTGVGKTKLALQLAQGLNGEIISADSVQVYKGLDIGSAKTPLQDRKGIPHHLIDILHPLEEYSVGSYFRDARKVTREILERGRVPIVVGGSGLYLRWYIYGKPDVPKVTPKISELVDSQLLLLEKSGDWDAAVQLLLKAGDPNACSVARNDWYRVRRALEIIKAAGVPKKAFPLPFEKFKETSCLPSSICTQTEENAVFTNSVESDFDFLCIFLSRKRTSLYQIIDQRCEEMVKECSGLLAEASWLLDMGICPNTTCASRAIGYQQAMEFLLNCRKAGGVCSENEFVQFLSDFQTASRNYAKRQVIWFRNEPLFHWLDASQPLGRLIEVISDAYQGSMNALLDKSVLSSKANSDADQKDLKRYHTENRHFVKTTDCASVLEWIKLTQSTGT